MLINGNTGKWEYVIGLEVHAQILSKSKLFSGASAEYGGDANTKVSLVDVAFPGMLPVLNEYCLHQAIKTGLALNAQVNEYSVFDRKNYFYPDLPQGYQISQFYYPLIQNGSVVIILEDGNSKTIKINRLHMEQDAGKSMHDQSPNRTFLDFNRCGIALMEIVTEPDLSSPYEAAEYMKKLRSILRYVGSCDGDMEKGSMRCDANISVRRPGGKLGTRCEIKNVNSIRNVVRAIEYEAMRQIEVIESGGVIKQETRLFDADLNETRTMRSKEDAHDYRYFPDPDLLPVKVSKELIDSIAKNMPELPDAKIRRYIKDLGLEEYDAEVIVADSEIATYFEEAAKFANAKMVANWINSELFGILNKHNATLDQCKITPSMLGSMVKLIENEVISGKLAKAVFEIMFETGQNPEDIVKERGLVQMSDSNALEFVVNEVLAENPDSVKGYKSGKDKLFGFFVGQIMKKTNGKANPVLANKILKDKLSE